MRVLSLFSGIGGLELGLEWAGMETVGQCEFDRYCRNVLEKHWPTVPRWIDIRSLTGEWVRDNCGHIDLICGGFPRQDISVAGKGAGIKGERSGLWQEMRRVIGEVRPRWVLAENVPALRTRGADEVLAGLEELGYTCWPCVVGSQSRGFVGKRVYVVAQARCERLATGRQVPIGEKRLFAVPASSGVHRRVAGPRERQYGWEKPRLVESPVGVSTDGVPARLVRLANRSALQSLGNAVVPQVAEQLGRAIMEVELAHSRRHRAAA